MQEPPGYKPCLSELTEAGRDIIRGLDSVEKSCLEKALELSGGNESKAAGILNINHHTIRYRIKKLGLK